MKNKTRLVLATRNKAKTTELQDLLKGFPVDIINLDRLGPLPEIEEDGETFEENAYKKAYFTARILGLPALADDSGLIVYALNGAPGVHSSRYAGDSASDEENVAKLLSEMEGKEDRSASFKCVIAVAVPSGPALIYGGTCNGVITRSPLGRNGFGYDPVFYYPPLKKTFAQLSTEEKALVSHRGLALAELKNEFDKVLTWIQQHTDRTYM
nr:XTP/dITP diphosphatase [Desulfobacterales bacterium]